MNQRERYEAHFRQKRANNGIDPVADLSDLNMNLSIKEGTAEAATRDPASETPGKTPEWKSAAQGAGAQMAQAGASSGSLGQTAGGAMMMTGNPYLMAGGLGLSVLAAGEQNKRAAEEAQRLEYNKRISERQKMMAQIAEMGIK